MNQQKLISYIKSIYWHILGNVFIPWKHLFSSLNNALLNYGMHFTKTRCQMCPFLTSWIFMSFFQKLYSYNFYIKSSRKKEHFSVVFTFIRLLWEATVCSRLSIETLEKETEAALKYDKQADKSCKQVLWGVLCFDSTDCHFSRGTNNPLQLFWLINCRTLQIVKTKHTIMWSRKVRNPLLRTGVFYHQFSNSSNVLFEP